MQLMSVELLSPVKTGYASMSLTKSPEKPLSFEPSSPVRNGNIRYRSTGRTHLSDCYWNLKNLTQYLSNKQDIFVNTSRPSPLIIFTIQGSLLPKIIVIDV